MRDPARIDRIIALLAEYWKLHPDLRLAQILGNMKQGGDPYFMEDEWVEDRLTRWLATVDISSIVGGERLDRLYPYIKTKRR